MFAWLAKLRNKNHCAICGKKADSPRKYYNDQGLPIVVCSLCNGYAERRAFRKRP